MHPIVFMIPDWMQRLLLSGQHVVTAPDRIETQVSQTGQAIQNAVEQLVFWAHVIAIVAVVYAILRLGFAFYSWNLRRREVIAEERQATADARTATALEGVLAELKKLSPSK